MHIEALQPGTKAERFFTFAREAVDAESRTATLAFSSETPVERYWGIEVLDHKNGSMRTERLKRGAPLLMDHDARDQVGVIESVQIGADRVARAVVRFGRSARASEVFQDVVDGIRQNVSTGYVIHAATLESESDGVGTYRVTDWEPFEVSIVSVPADTRVGIGRSAEPVTSPQPSEKSTMSDKDTAAPQPEPQPAAEVRAATVPAQPAAAPQPSAQDERKRAAAIIAIGEAHGLQQLAAESVRDGTSVQDFQARALEALGTKPTPTSDVGLSQREVQRYSMLRAINALANPRDKRAQEAAAFEIEVSQSACDKLGRQSRGIYVPGEVLRRDLTVGTATAGGHTVAIDLKADSFIDLLRHRLLLPGMGATLLTDLVGNVAIPRQTGGATAYWVAESGSPTESQQAFDQVTLSPKTVGAFTDISRKLLLQSSADVENFVQGDLAKVLALAIQQAAISGSGTAPEPRGILNTTGIGTLGGTNGDTLNHASIVGLETEVAVDNADIGTLAYLTNARARGKAKVTYIDGSGTGIPVWGGGSTPLNGYRAEVTNAVPSNLTQGSGTDLSAIIFGNWADLLIGLWGGLDLMVDPYTGSTSGTVRIVALQDVDVAVRHPESFAAGKFITT
jgi:Phage capsid family./Caudovirus prohead protease.